jgi:hypothetical protein
MPVIKHRNKKIIRLLMSCSGRDYKPNVLLQDHELAVEQTL